MLIKFSLFPTSNLCALGGTRSYPLSLKNTICNPFMYLMGRRRRSSEPWSLFLLSCHARSPNKASLEVSHGSKDARCPFIFVYSILLAFDSNLLSFYFFLSFSFLHSFLLSLYLPFQFFIIFCLRIALNFSSFHGLATFRQIFISSRWDLTLSCRLKLRYPGVRIRKTNKRNSDSHLYEGEEGLDMLQSEGYVSRDQMKFLSNFSWICTLFNSRGSVI